MSSRACFHQSFFEEIYCYHTYSTAAVCICIFGGMDFYAIYGITPYTDPPVFPVYYNPTEVRTNATTSTMGLTTTALLVSTILRSVPSASLSASVLTTLPTTSKITTCVTSSYMTSYRRKQRNNSGSIASRKSSYMKGYYGKKFIPTSIRNRLYATCSQRCRIQE